MKLFPNPITSPSRLDKFQSPLKRSLRKNGVGSRSRGRSRLSPMFIRKKNELVETLEPSSPKVTCFGQVRVRKSKSGRHTTKHRCCCCCCCCSIRKALFCTSSRFDGKSKPSRSFRSVWERWFLFSFPSKRTESIQTIREVTEEEEEDEESDEEEEEEEEEEEAGGRGRGISSSPPKNALLLMRSKSESYRPSSLANLFWGSPVSVKDSEEIRIPEIITEQRSDGEEEDEERPTSEKELTCRDSTSESRKNGSKIEEKLGLCDEIETRSSTTNNIRSSSSKIEDESGRNPSPAPAPVPALPPIVLRRSKSEPASRRGISVKLDSLENWKGEIYNKLDSSVQSRKEKEKEKEGRDSLY